jgi:hypothetical protein
MTGGNVQVDVRVLGPHWVRASRVLLFSNGSLIREHRLDGEPSQNLPSGVQWQEQWALPRPVHDVHLVAIVIGQGIDRREAAAPVQAGFRAYGEAWDEISAARSPR